MGTRERGGFTVEGRADPIGAGGVAVSLTGLNVPRPVEGESCGLMRARGAQVCVSRILVLPDRRCRRQRGGQP
jgi:hypothetical protein